MEKPKWASSRYNGGITTKAETMERQDKAALTDRYFNYLYGGSFLRSYDLQELEFSICSNRCEVGV